DGRVRGDDGRRARERWPRDHLARAVNEIILASSSPRRRELLTLVGIPHRVRPADIDENVLPDETPLPHVERLAREKATAVAGTRSAGEADTIVLAADTIVVLDGEILGKPRTEAEA